MGTVLVTAAACISPGEPAGPPLTSRFGGQNTLVKATDSSAWYEFICLNGHTGALRRSGSSYQASGLAGPFSGPADAPPLLLEVTATAVGDTVIDFMMFTRNTVTGDTAADRYRAKRDATPNLPFCSM